MADLSILDVICQHAEEASFLWHLRSVVVYEPHFSLRDLAALDARIEAHLDGLRLASAAGWEMCRKGMKLRGAGEIFTAAVLAFESGDESRIREVLAVGSTSQNLSRGIISALAWIPFERSEDLIHSLSDSESPSHRVLGIAAAAAHSKYLPGPTDYAMSHSHPILKARALRAVGELGVTKSFTTLQRFLSDQNEPCRFWAAWSAALLRDDRTAISILKSIAESDSPFRQKALQMALRRMSLPEAKAWQAKLAQMSDQARYAVTAAGVIGDPELVPWLIDMMRFPSLARVAGEAFSLCTGAYLVRDKLDGARPEGFEAGPTESPDDPRVQMDPDEYLPWPNRAAIEYWWSQNSPRFQRDTRYFMGRRIDVALLNEILWHGGQRYRAAAAIQLAMGNPGQPLFEVRAPGYRQYQALAEKDLEVNRAKN